MRIGTVKNLGTIYRRKGSKEFPADADARKKEVREAPFYIRYSVNGKQKRQVLRDDNGDRIFDRNLAEEARLKLLKPLLSRHKSEQMKEFISRLRDVEEETSIAEQEAKGSTQLDKAWECFLKNPNRRDTGESTLKQYSFQFTRFVKWTKENKPQVSTMADVDAGVAKDFARSLIEEGRSANTYNKYLGLLKLIWRVLEEDAGITSNPWTKIARREQSPQSREILSKEQLRRVCESSEGEMRMLFAVGMYTGLRLKDCALLKWDNVDLERNKLIVVPYKTRNKHRDPIHIPIFPALREMLLETTKGKRQGYVMPAIAEKYERRPDKLSRQIQRHFRNCGIETIKPGTGKGTGKKTVVRIGFHSLRHTFVSLSRDAGAPLSVVEAIVGHSNPVITRLYTHSSEQAATAVINSLPDLLGNGDTVEQEPDLLSIIQDRLNSMTKNNWEKLKGELLYHIENADKYGK